MVAEIIRQPAIWPRDGVGTGTPKLCDDGLTRSHSRHCGGALLRDRNERTEEMQKVLCFPRVFGIVRVIPNHSVKDRVSADGGYPEANGEGHASADRNSGV